MREQFMLYRLIVTLLLLSFSYSCANVENEPTATILKPEVDPYSFMGKLKKDIICKDIIFLHVDARQDLIEGQRVGRGESLGKIQSYPLLFSEKFNSEYLESQKLYNSRDYLSAANILTKAIQEEPDNPFLLNQYARSLFWIPSFKKDSFDTYSKLIHILDKQTKEQDSVVIDLWFAEAYWKIASLHLDQGEYQKAIFEISRFLIGYAGHLSNQAYEQAFEYLAEAHYYLKETENAKYFAKLALDINPQNKKVKIYMGN